MMQNSVDYIVLGLLGLMSIAAFAIFLERKLCYRSLDLHRFTHRKELELLLTHRLNLIAIIASNAPYVGLLGTVIGIMLTFRAMGRDGLMDTGHIMSGLAMALKATAAGLIVAIPSVTLYNLLLRQVKVLLMHWDIRHG